MLSKAGNHKFPICFLVSTLQTLRWKSKRKEDITYLWWFQERRLHTRHTHPNQYLLRIFQFVFLFSERKLLAWLGEQFHEQKFLTAPVPYPTDTFHLSIHNNCRRQYEISHFFTCASGCYLTQNQPVWCIRSCCLRLRLSKVFLWEIWGRKSLKVSLAFLHQNYFHKKHSHCCLCLVLHDGFICDEKYKSKPPISSLKLLHGNGKIFIYHPLLFSFRLAWCYNLW